MLKKPSTLILQEPEKKKKPGKKKMPEQTEGTSCPEIKLPRGPGDSVKIVHSDGSSIFLMPSKINVGLWCL